MKTCKCCKKSKPKTEFHVNRMTKDSLQTHCKKCISERNKAPDLKPRRCIYSLCKTIFTPLREKTKCCSLEHYKLWVKDGRVNAIYLNNDRRKEHVGYEFGDSVCVSI